MFRNYVILFIIFSFCTILNGQDLPRYLTEQEKVLMETYTSPSIETGFTTPPSFSPRTMAEWEELDGILVTWTSFQSILSQIIDHAQEEGKVYIVCSDSNSVKSYLTGQGVPHTNLVFLVESFNSIWCRDYGPWTIYKNYTEQKSFVDWVYNRPRPADDLIPGALGDYLGVDVYSTTVSPYRLTNTGGNFMTDGHGTAFCSDLIFEDNSSLSESQINQIVNEFMGVDRYIKMDDLPYDEIHHIDMHMKLLDEETLLVGKYPTGVSDGPQIEANLQYVLDNFKTCFNRDFKVIRIPMPPDAQGRYPNQGGDYRTYTNSVFVNKTVIVPTYEVQYDTTALRIYREALPGYNIVGVNSNSIIPLLGAIHCITKEIGSQDPIFISHAKILEGYYNTPTEVKTFLNSQSGISEARLFWSTDTLSGYNEIVMNTAPGDTFYAAIPAQDYGTDIFYYIEAENNNGKVTRKPLVAPRGVYHFSIGEEQLNVGIEINPGWNLVSVPLNLPDMSPESIFSDAASAVFGYILTYTMASEIEPGHAYWVKYDSEETISITGTRPEGNITLTEDWNMIGPFNRAMPVEEIYTNPEGIITTQFYSSNNGYTPADTISPGRGYWVKTSSAGEIIVDVPVEKIEKNTLPEPGGNITITDASGKIFSLYLLDNSSNSAYYEMPPKAPGNSSDVRFDDNTSAISRNEIKRLVTENINYPIQISSNVSNLLVNGKLNNGGDIAITSPSVITVSFVELPTEYKLSQNFPNPFNPTTKIQFALPVDSKVKLTIFNTLGQKVEEISEMEYSAGLHEFNFDGTELASGIYLYNIEASGIDGNNFSSTKKMILMK